MGSPLAPAIADICMNWLTSKVLAKIKNPPVIIRYVDDLYLAFDNPNDVESVYQKFNFIHPNLKFTKEENDKKMPFLNILITKTFKNLKFKKPKNLITKTLNGTETTVYKNQYFQG